MLGNNFHASNSCINIFLRPITSSHLNMIRLLICLLSVILVAASTHSPDVVAERHKTMGETGSNRTLGVGSGILGAGTCTGEIDGDWVLAATKWDLDSAEILEESTVAIKSAKVNNMDQTSFAYEMESPVTFSTDINFDLYVFAF